MERIERLNWHKSTYSGSNGGNCVEVARDGESVLVRNTRDREGGTLAFTTGEWRAFLAGARDGEFDLEH
jgi:hypothetical protein